MEDANIVLTIVIAVIGVSWPILLFVFDIKRRKAERTSGMMERLLDLDKTIIEHPKIQKYISENATRDENYFRDSKRLEEEDFFRSKAFIYMQLNAFDDMLSSSAYLKDELVEMEYWKQYVSMKLKHPWYRSILQTEGYIFGEALTKFFKNPDKHTDAQVNCPDNSDPFSW